MMTLDREEVKTTEYVQSFMREMMKEVIETLYECELVSHLGHFFGIFTLRLDNFLIKPLKFKMLR